jgi:hypothetical protein
MEVALLVAILEAEDAMEEVLVVVGEIKRKMAQNAAFLLLARLHIYYFLS